MKNRITIIIAIFIVPNILFAQEITGTIRGIVKEQNSVSTLEMASVILTHDTLQFGVNTKKDGSYKIEVPTNRYQLVVRLLGYQPVEKLVNITSGKETVVNIELEKDIQEIQQVVVKAYNKREAINSLAFAGSRNFNTDEAYLYAGTLGDPARMVRSYAGVMPVNDSRNDIVIRGNSPIGVQWRLDDIEIPNPNHYGGMGLTGSTITLLNTNLLSNSDFFMGAWPAPYGNALSGIFDLHMREGNNQKREFWFQNGWNGFEIGSDGYYNKKRKATYIADYRYSFLDLLSKIGLKQDFVPKYQDFTFKSDFEINKKQELSFLGIWGTSSLDLLESDKNTRDLGPFGQDLRTKSDALVAGIKHKIFISNYQSLKSGISYIKSGVNTRIDTFNVDNRSSRLIWDENSNEEKFSVFSKYANNFSDKGRIIFGVIYDYYKLNYNEKTAELQISDEKGSFDLWRAYSQFRYYFNSKIKATIGLHSMYMTLNNSKSVEPRAGIQYKFSPRQSLAISGGTYSQMQPRPLYFVESVVNNQVIQTNRDMGFSRSAQLDLSYKLNLTKQMLFKSEIYYQNLFNIPVKNSEKYVYSLLNTGADYYIPREDSLVNKGKGLNYGMEITMEHFLSNNFYFLFTTTLYESKFSAIPANKTYNTAFNGQFILNLATGYELKFNKTIALAFDLKSTLAGGQYYTPVNESASIAAKSVIYDYDKAFSAKEKNYFRTDIKISYRQNFKKYYYEFDIDLQNITNYKNILRKEFMPERKEYLIYYQQGFMPMYTLKIEF